MFSLSCSDMETIVDLEIPTHESMLVLNGRLDTDKEIKVLLSNSVGAFDNNRPAMVNDANITLFEDGVNLGNPSRFRVKLRDGNYWSEIFQCFWSTSISQWSLCGCHSKIC